LSGSHAHALHYHGHSLIHRLAPEVKLVALLGFVVAVVATPPEAIWAFWGQAVILLALLAVSGVPPRFFLARLSIDLPFVVFALLLPFLGAEPKVEWGPLHLSLPGLTGAWNIIAKATLGAGASVLLVATTEVADVIAGLNRLRVPRVITGIASFMVRYLEVVASEVRRTRIAMTARGYRPQWLAQTRPLATAAGTLFIRSYERGERVHQAMVARGFQGVMPEMAVRRRPRWWMAAVPVVPAALLAVLAWVGR
jgi:cobalt/nickel transport system permease protein